MHDLNSWSEFKMMYTANESCIFLVATVEERVSKTVEKIVGCTGLHKPDDAAYTKVVLEQDLSPNTIVVAVRIFSVFNNVLRLDLCTLNKINSFSILTCF